MKMILIVTAMVLSMNPSAFAVVFNDNMQLAPGSCSEDHGQLIQEFAEEQFGDLQLRGKVGIDDEFNGVTAYRRVPKTDDGNTEYALDMYGKTPKDQRIPPVDENDNPNGTRDYRCFGTIVVTKTCEVIMGTTDFMDAEKLQRQGREALDELGDEIEPDDRGRVGVTVKVPKVKAMTCNRPEAMVMF